MGPGEEYLGAFGGAFYIHDVDLDAVSDAVSFAGDLLAGGKYAFCPAHVDEHGTVGDALHYACNYLGLSGDIVVVDHAALGLPDPLDNYLLGSLSRDTAEIHGSYHIFYYVTYLVFRIDLPCFFQRCLRERIFNFGNDVPSHEDIYISGLPVDVHADILGCSVVLFIGRDESRFYSVDEHVLGHVLFSLKCFDRL